MYATKFVSRQQSVYLCGACAQSTDGGIVDIVEASRELRELSGVSVLPRVGLKHHLICAYAASRDTRLSADGNLGDFRRKQIKGR